MPPGPVAAIDVGTNTVLMVVGRRRPDGAVEVLEDAHAIARLGENVDARRRIGEPALERLCGILLGHRQRALELGAGRVAAFGTSALRDAANGAEVVARVQERTGIALATLSGAQEARLTFAGAAFGLRLPARYAVLDVGGGSTELAVGTADGPEVSGSVDVGAVRLTERCFPSLPPAASQLQEATAVARRSLAGLPACPAGVPLVGVAGTVTTLGAMDLDVERFDAEALNGHFLPRARVEVLSDQLLGLGHAQIAAIPQVSPQRADIISAGSLILRLALQAWGCPGVVVSTRGIRYGLLLRELGCL
ncbi:MAG: Ppx/GppA phosphatase family protein [Candidatus Latescibacterota bacterium]